MWINEFSNFYLPAHKHILYEHIAYPSIEHFFVAMMTTDIAERLKIAGIEHPAEAKKYGKGFARRKDWHRVKRSVMLFALRQKFTDPSMKEALLDSGDQEIVHLVHWHDNYWASCVCPKCADKEKGNMLGILLMKVRAEISDHSNITQYLSDWHQAYYGTPCKVLV